MEQVSSNIRRKYTKKNSTTAIEAHTFQTVGKRYRSKNAANSKGTDQNMG